MVRYHDDLEPLLRPIDEVRPHPENPNNGDVDAICESIEVNGMYRPVYAQKSTSFVIVGNHTWEAAKRLDAKVVPVVWLDVDDEAAKRLMLADNKIASLAMLDPSAELALLEELAASETDLQGTGYRARDLEVLRHLAEIPVEHDEFGQWPTICVQVPPQVRRAYYDLTDTANGDRERFELLLRLAGWDGEQE
jgi:ParB-like chromosome segregation protein Spo0J